jgi:hypothetical protein
MAAINSLDFPYTLNNTFRRFSVRLSRPRLPLTIDTGVVQGDLLLSAMLAGFRPVISPLPQSLSNIQFGREDSHDLDA